MTIWNDARLRVACNAVAPLVTPFDAAHINPASIDLRLGAEYRLPYPNRTDPSIFRGFPNTASMWGGPERMDAAGLKLPPGAFILCCTLEIVHIPVHAAAELFCKSSTGRVGLEHLHAGWIDPGFRGQLTLELHNVAPWPVQLVPGKAYMQMVVHELVAPALRDYSKTGRYQDQAGATPAREEQP